MTESGIASIFAGRPVTALLRTVMLNPARDYYQRELVDATGLRLFQIQRGLTRLQRAGVVTTSVRGNRRYYRANRSHPAFEELKSVILKTFGLGEALRAEIGRLGDSVRAAFVYGSVARGEESDSSDVDLMIVGDISSRAVSSVLVAAKRRLNRDINVAVYSVDELRKRFAARHPFAREIVGAPKIFILGDDHVLDEIVGRGSSPEAPKQSHRDPRPSADRRPEHSGRRG